MIKRLKKITRDLWKLIDGSPPVTTTTSAILSKSDSAEALQTLVAVGWSKESEADEIDENPRPLTTASGVYYRGSDGNYATLQSHIQWYRNGRPPRKAFKFPLNTRPSPKRTDPPEDADSCGDPIVEENVVFLRERSLVGQAKYGKKLNRDDLSPVQWMDHLLEELGDALNYGRRNRNNMGDCPRCLAGDSALADRIQRCAKVEQEMLDAANGKTPAPSLDQVRKWALRLGTPGEFLSGEGQK